MGSLLEPGSHPLRHPLCPPFVFPTEDGKEWRVAPDERPLGTSANGYVYRGHRSDGASGAVKVLWPSSPEQKSSVDREVNALSHFSLAAASLFIFGTKGSRLG